MVASPFRLSNLFLVLLLCVFSTLNQAQTPASIIFQNVNVVDVNNGSLLTNQTVVVSGNTIIEIGPVEHRAISPDDQVIDAEGKYLIPGLWDMHVHATYPGQYERFYPLLLANGVTGIRDTWGSVEVAFDARAAIASGELVGPVRSVVAGNLVDGPGQIWSGSRVAITPGDGREIVTELHAAGAPFIKVYSSLFPKTFRAIAEQANLLGVPFAGHVPEGVKALTASVAGIRSMEHLKGVLEGCSSEEQALINESMRALRVGRDRDTQQILHARDARALATQDDQKCRLLAQLFIDNETWQVPTLVTNRGYSHMPEMAAKGDFRLRYLVESDYQNWFPASNRFVQGRTQENWALDRAVFARELEIVGMMAEMGVPFLAGSDATNPWTFPGFSLHDELQLLVDAGMNPLQALQAATLNPARFFARDTELGSVEVGKLADLVLLDANPLEDISNSKTISAVVANGQLYLQADLDQILAETEAEASRVSVAKVLYEVIESEGVLKARERYGQLRDESPDTIRFGEDELVGLGYRLLGEGRLNEAVEIFELSVAAYPNAPNPYDSLGEALTATGQCQKALDAHAIAVELAEQDGDKRLEAFIERLRLAQERLGDCLIDLSEQEE